MQSSPECARGSEELLRGTDSWVHHDCTTVLGNCVESAFSGCVPSDLGTAGVGTADQQQGEHRLAPRGTWERLRPPPSACFRNNSGAGVGGRRTWSSSTSWSQKECSGAQTEPWLAHPTLRGPGQGCLCPASHRGPLETRQSPLWVKVGLPFFPGPQRPGSQQSTWAGGTVKFHFS